jgi:ZIP family zinc transporter
MNINVFIGILIPFIGTSLGAALVYLMKDKINDKVMKVLLGFAAGVMIAASIWSLLLPAIEQERVSNHVAWLTPAIGFMIGIIFLLLLDTFVPHMHTNSKVEEGVKSNFSKITKLLLAVTLHNIPEGMAVGVVFAGYLSGNTAISFTAALALTIGIAIQNFPEGAIISMPLKVEGVSKHKAFVLGVLSGIVEPIGAIITILLTSLVTPLMPLFLSFAAGAMIYVVVEELIPESQSGSHTNLATIGVSVGFVLMMILDIQLG